MGKHAELPNLVKTSKVNTKKNDIIIKKKKIRYFWQKYLFYVIVVIYIFYYKENVVPPGKIKLIIMLINRLKKKIIINTNANYKLKIFLAECRKSIIYLYTSAYNTNLLGYIFLN